MIEIIKNIAVDFVLFSGIEGLILLLFFNRVFDYKFNFLHWLLLSSVNSVLTVIFPPIVRQWIAVLWISMFLYLFKEHKDKYLKCLFASICSMAMIIILEVLYDLLLLKFVNFEAFNFLTDSENFKLFILIIPLRIIEVINILMIGVIRMKLLIGGVVRK